MSALILPRVNGPLINHFSLEIYAVLKYSCRWTNSFHTYSSHFYRRSMHKTKGHVESAIIVKCPTAMTASTTIDYLNPYKISIRYLKTPLRWLWPTTWLRPITWSRLIIWSRPYNMSIDTFKTTTWLMFTHVQGLPHGTCARSSPWYMWSIAVLVKAGVPQCWHFQQTPIQSRI
jgi:hypothetical protein